MRLSAGSCSDTSISSMLPPVHRSTYSRSRSEAECCTLYRLSVEMDYCLSKGVTSAVAIQHLMLGMAGSRQWRFQIGAHTSATTASSSMGLNVQVE